MDDLNKRVLSVMEVKGMSKSTFALALDISLPVLTHIGSGRNKPGLELITRIIATFPDISPDWLLLGSGTMIRVEMKKLDISKELNKLASLEAKIPDFATNASQILEYHALLLKEILYLNELSPYLKAIQNNSSYVANEIKQVIDEINIKVKD
jgi:DNA-binding XRE family transcriptional regulator